MFIGLVGKPSSGKSTFFKAATLAEVEIGNRPFVTINPNEGTSYVKIDCVDKEFNKQCNPRLGYCLNHNRFVSFTLMDVAGLIKDAHKGAGLGNKFLDDLSGADAFIHIVDISGSTDEQGNSVKALSHDPIKDIKFLDHELDMWYFQILKRGWEKFARGVKNENKEVKEELAKQISGLKVNEKQVEDMIKELNLLHDPTQWEDNDLLELAKKLRRKSKPMIIAANKIDIEGSAYNLDRVKKEFPDYLIIPCGADSELALREAAKHNLIEYIPGEDNFEVKGDLSEEQKKALDYIKKNVLEEFGSTGVQEVLNKAVFDLLKYIAVFPGGVNKLEDSKGNILPDCFLLEGESTALDFAYKIHQDIGDGFVKAMNVKKKQPIGKEYKLQHRDVIEILTKN
jgi:ribosome-binding ATPase